MSAGRPIVEKLPTGRTMTFQDRGTVVVDVFRHHNAYKVLQPEYESTQQIRQWLVEHVGYCGRDWFITQYRLQDIDYCIINPAGAFLFKLKWC